MVGGKPQRGFHHTLAYRSVEQLPKKGVVRSTSHRSNMLEKVHRQEVSFTRASLKTCAFFSKKQQRVKLHIAPMNKRNGVMRLPHDMGME